MKIKGAIFDFDGTLFDSMVIWETAGDKYLKSLGIEPEVGLHEKIRDFSMIQSAIYVKENYNLDFTCEEIVAGFNKSVEEFYLTTALPKKGVIEFLEKIKSHGITMCVATVTEKRLIEAALERCEIRHFFKDVITCGEVGHGKDKPFIYRKAMDIMGLSHESTIVFEDALYAIRTAKGDGFTTAGVYDESEKSQDEFRNFADFFIKDYYDTHDLLNFMFS